MNQIEQEKKKYEDYANYNFNNEDEFNVFSQSNNQSNLWYLPDWDLVIHFSFEFQNCTYEYLFMSGLWKRIWWSKKLTYLVACCYLN